MRAKEFFKERGVTEADLRPNFTFENLCYWMEEYHQHNKQECKLVEILKNNKTIKK